jgi:glycosyltransferase involved in cell wall biosynthesis
VKPVFFSVIVPVYQARKYLKKCLKSIAMQSFKNFEIVAVDDASNDESAELIEKFSIQNPDIQIQLYLNAKNLGLGASRNRGISHALGKYVCFLDADDYWESNKLEILYQKIKENSSHSFFYHRVKELPGLRKRAAYAVKSIDELAFRYNPIVPSAVALQSSLAQKYLHLEDKSLQGVEDFDLWMRLIGDGVIPFYFPDALTVYRTHSGMSVQLNDHISKVSRILELYFGPLEYKKALLQKYYEAGRSCMKMGKYHQALMYFRMSKRLNFKTLYFSSICLLKT